MIEASGFIATVVLAALFIFQILLISGVPLGKYAWGGRHSVLPKQLRIASVSSLFLYAAFMTVLLDKASLVETIDSDTFVDTSMWIFTGYFFLGIIMNAASRSKPERLLMTPVAVILAITFLVVSLS